MGTARVHRSDKPKDSVFVSKLISQYYLRLPLTKALAVLDSRVEERSVLVCSV